MSRIARHSNAPTGSGGLVTSERQAAFTAPGISPRDGEKVAEALQQRLYALIDLTLTLKHIHWNVVGPAFISVHQMLDPQHAGVSAMVDDLAERIATLGGVPSGLPGRLVQSRSWDDYELGRADTQAHLGALDLVYRNVVADHRKAIETVGRLDPVSEGLLVDQTRDLEMYHWFVRSHLADWAGGIVTAGTETEIDAARAAVLKTGSARTRSVDSRNSGRIPRAKR
jgi:starvation-inducible DNA-binding protein